MNQTTKYDADAEIALIERAFATRNGPEGSNADAPTSISAVLMRKLPVPEEMVHDSRAAILTRALAQFPLSKPAATALREVAEIERRDIELKAKADEIAVDAVAASFERMRVERSSDAASRGAAALTGKLDTSFRAREDANAEERAVIARARARLGANQIKPLAILAEGCAASLKSLAEKVKADETKAWEGFGNFGESSQTVLALQTARVLFARQVIVNVRQKAAEQDSHSSHLAMARTIFRGWLPPSTWA